MSSDRKKKFNYKKILKINKKFFLSRDLIFGMITTLIEIEEYIFKLLTFKKY